MFNVFPYELNAAKMKQQESFDFFPNGFVVYKKKGSHQDILYDRVHTISKNLEVGIYILT